MHSAGREPLSLVCRQFSEVTDMGAEALSAARERVRLDRDRLREWLFEEALPLWSTHGIDPLDGGFEERLSAEGAPTHESRRARVQPRQLFAFVGAWRLGWQGGAEAIVARGLNYFVHHFRRPDGLYRALIAPDGVPLDESVYLYDQAFALLGLASAQRILGSDSDYERPAAALLERVAAHLKHDQGGFETGLPERLPLQSNPHMHLLEACLEWQQVSEAPCWGVLAGELIELVLQRFIDRGSTLVRETFAADWSAAPSLPGRLIEPGHQFEWAWLLLRVSGARQHEARQTAARLIEGGEHHGVRGGVAIDELLDDLSVHRATARLWPQTERLRALACMAALGDEPRYWSLAHEAAQSLMRYLNAAVPGLWHDELLPDGRFRIGPAPAGNLYHIVGAILALDEALTASAVPHVVSR
ncbi:MAG: AGE family epimerase/isomerase [Steroidobacteraceae bacterium]